MQSARRTLWFRLRIGPATWNVYLAARELLTALMPGHDYEGCTLLEESAIYINRELPRDRWPDVFVHELLHAVVFVSGATETAPLSDSREEKVVAALAPLLTHALLDLRSLRLPKPPAH